MSGEVKPAVDGFFVFDQSAVESGVVATLSKEAEPEPIPEYDHVGYLEYLIRMDRLVEVVENCKEALLQHGIVFDAIACRGVSGMLIGPPLALAMKKELIIVRKDDAEGLCHSSKRCEGFRGTKRYIIADDVVSSGHTVYTIQHAIEKWAPHAKYIGTLCANSLYAINEINETKEQMRLRRIREFELRMKGEGAL